ncbi:hypothetical protein IFM89_000370 [Coptis chinensis]|uniref:Uncharacterized protein n=1 Tax=Coptis chinensis TaxID=261450 RepID=A0A835HBV8_9MAGN|nr:hypothetical protein IFM89_000370 [Coptis chinensis]
MEKKQKISEYRDRLDKTLACHDLVNEESVKNLVRTQLVRTCPPDIKGYIDNIVEKRAAEVSEFLDTLRSTRIDGEVSKTEGIPHRDWKLKQDNEDYRVMYREGPEGTPFHTLLVEGYVDAPLDVCLCLSWEATLFKNWWPQFNVPPFKIISSSCLQEVRIGEQICHMRIILKETNFGFILCFQISDAEDANLRTHGFTRDRIPDAKDIVRIDVVGGFVLQKVNSSTSYFRTRISDMGSALPRTIATMDIKLDFVPPSLLNFVSRQLIGSGFKLYKKTVASIAKGDEVFSKALEAPVYVHVREGLDPKNKLKSTRKPESLERDKSAGSCVEGLATVIPPVDTMVLEQIPLGDSHLSSQAGTAVTGQTYNCEIEEVEAGTETQTMEKCQTSHQEMELDLEEDTDLEEDEVLDHCSTNITVDRCSAEKTSISPEVEHALRVLDNAISMVRKGFSFEWSGFGSKNQDVLHVQKAASRVSSSSSEDISDGEDCQKAPKVDKMDTDLDEDESSSDFLEIRYFNVFITKSAILKLTPSIDGLNYLIYPPSFQKNLDKVIHCRILFMTMGSLHNNQDSPVWEVNHNKITPPSPKQNSTPMVITQEDSWNSSQNGGVLEVPALDKMSSVDKEVTIWSNDAHDIHEVIDNKEMTERYNDELSSEITAM